MKKYKRKAAHLLLTVFTVILVSTIFQAYDLPIEETEEITVVHKHEHSCEAPGNVSRTYVDHTGYESRTFHDFAFFTIEEFHSQLSRTGFDQLNFNLRQFRAPVKLYKLIQKFLI